MPGHFNNPLGQDTPKEFDPGRDPGGQHLLDAQRAGNEAHSGVDQLFQKLAPYAPMTIETADGRRINVLGIEAGTEEDTDPVLWKLGNLKDGDARVYAGSISGMGLSDETPPEMTKGEWFTFSVGDTRQIFYLWFHFDPNNELRDYNEQTDLYAIEDGGTVTSWGWDTVDIDVGIPARVKPTVDPSSGTGTGGKYYKEIGYVGGGSPVQQIRSGPLTISFCATDSFLLFSG